MQYARPNRRLCEPMKYRKVCNWEAVDVYHVLLSEICPVQCCKTAVHSRVSVSRTDGF